MKLTMEGASELRKIVREHPNTPPLNLINEKLTNQELELAIRIASYYYNSGISGTVEHLILSLGSCGCTSDIRALREIITKETKLQDSHLSPELKKVGLNILLEAANWVVRFCIRGPIRKYRPQPEALVSRFRSYALFLWAKTQESLPDPDLSVDAALSVAKQLGVPPEEMIVMQILNHIARGELTEAVSPLVQLLCTYPDHPMVRMVGHRYFQQLPVSSRIEVFNYENDIRNYSIGKIHPQIYLKKEFTGLGFLSDGNWYGEANYAPIEVIHGKTLLKVAS